MARAHKIISPITFEEYNAFAGLTWQEKKVAYLFAVEHMSSTDIADRLFCQPGTIRTHIKRIYLKLGITDREDLRFFLARIEYAFSLDEVRLSLKKGINDV